MKSVFFFLSKFKEKGKWDDNKNRNNIIWVEFLLLLFCLLLLTRALRAISPQKVRKFNLFLFFILFFDVVIFNLMYQYNTILISCKWIVFVCTQKKKLNLLVDNIKMLKKYENRFFFFIFSNKSETEKIECHKKLGPVHTSCKTLHAEFKRK